jgi:hypothetical protein
MSEKTELLRRQIESLDVKSDDFFNLYKIIWDKYWDLPDDASDYMREAKGLSMFIERYDTDKVIILGKIATQLFKMGEEKSDAIAMTLGFDDKDYTIKISTSEAAGDKFDDMLEKAHSAIESGNMKIKKKGLFGKKFF